MTFQISAKRSFTMPAQPVVRSLSTRQLMLPMAIAKVNMWKEVNNFPLYASTYEIRENQAAHRPIYKMTEPLSRVTRHRTVPQSRIAAETDSLQSHSNCRRQFSRTAAVTATTRGGVDLADRLLINVSIPAMMRRSPPQRTDAGRTEVHAGTRTTRKMGMDTWL